MILLPVIERELRVAARGRRIYRTRFAAAAAVIGGLFWIFSQRTGLPPDRLGAEIFDSATAVSLALCLLAGLFHTADAISAERRGGTLGLLFLTDLRSFHVVLGKLIAHSIPAFLALAAILPVLGIPLLLGGVSPGELARAALTLYCALSLSLCAGLLASCLAKDDRVALVMTVGFLLVLLLVPPSIRQAWISPLFALQTGRDSFYSGFPAKYWLSIAGQAGLALSLLLLAAFSARRVWRDHPPSAAMEKRQVAWRVWSLGKTHERTAWRQALLDENPALWLSCRHRIRAALLWAVVGGAICIGFWSWLPTRRIDSGLAMILSLAAHWFLKGAIAFAAARSLAEEARAGAFELLFTTPLTPRALVQGHLLGLARSFGPAMAAILLADVFWITAPSGGIVFERIALWCRVSVLPLDAFTIAVLALSLGHILRSPGRAAMGSFALVVILPNLAPLFFVRTGNWPGVCFLWFLIDAVLIWIAVSRLRGLRRQAAERFVSSSVPE